LKLLKRLLQEKLSLSEFETIQSAFDIIGHIAIVKISNDLEDKEQLISNTILDNIPNVSSVYAQVEKIEGPFRLRSLKFLAGVELSKTIYKENGCKFIVDVSDVYFTPRLSYERLRISNLIQPNEVVVNLFGGIAPFSIVIAKHNPTVKCYSVDINPKAIDLASENVKINKLFGKVIPVLGNSDLIIKENLFGKANRVLMPLPESSNSHLYSALNALSPNGGVVHYYRHVFARGRDEALDKVNSEISEIIGHQWKFISSRIVREIGPRWFEVVVDFWARMN